MSNCFQFENINMLQHGEMVHESYLQLMQDLENGKEVPIFQELYDLTKHKILPTHALKNYHIYHDCGKHIQIEYDENGRRQFPNHAANSTQQYAILFRQDVNTQFLILHDMHFHTKRGDELAWLFRHPLGPNLFFTALAEINANCQMFGGRNSDSYKIKLKRLIQTSKKFISSLKDANND